MTTPLGRSVRVNDWAAYQGDVILKMLYDYFSALTSLEEGRYFPLSIASIVNGSTLDLDEARLLLEELQSRGLIKYDRGSHNAWLTDDGLNFVEQALSAGGQ